MYFCYLASSCRTMTSSSNTNPDPNKACVFPFTYRGNEYTQCTSLNNGGVFWCATEVSSGGAYITDKWGVCTEECRTAGTNYNTGDGILPNIILHNNDL